jgi:hypothetical protein
VFEPDAKVKRMVNFFGRVIRLTPDKPHAEEIVALSLHQHMVERPLEDEPGARLLGGSAGHPGIAEAITPEPAKGRVRTQLLLEVEAESPTGGAIGPGRWLRAGA